MKRHRKKMRLFFILFFFFFAILVVIFFQSSLSRIDRIVVNGIDRLTAEEVIELSKIQHGDQLLLLSHSKVKENLLVSPLVKKAEITTQFPGKVIIDVQEYRTVAYLLNPQQKLQPILENGKIMEKESANRVINEPIITEWPALESLPNFCKELAQLNSKVLGEISEIRLTPTENDPYKLTLFMRDGFEVHTSMVDFANHIKNYPYIVDNIENRDPGVIHLTDAGVYYISFQDLRESSNENIDTTEHSPDRTP